jgi:hypothetical protein
MDEVTVESDAQIQSPTRFQFTLRTLFVVVAMVAASVGLFLRYYGWPGLILGILLLLGGCGDRMRGETRHRWIVSATE